ncbi:hypothetical protein [Streptomyces sp. NBC_00286]|nr:hypothetical protein [Streptomyces sp. NBC_00286]
MASTKVSGAPRRLRRGAPVHALLLECSARFGDASDPVIPAGW